MPKKNAIVLVVEDEILLREMIAEELRDAGFDVLEAADGDVASRFLLADGRIDVLFTDIRLPGRLDGWAVAQLAREHRTALPVIYASGYTVDRSAVVPDAIFLDKPYQPSLIVATIRKLVG
jgi:DNA-binding response OmpR family regulator